MKRSVVEALESRRLLHAGHEESGGLVGEYFDNNNLTNLKFLRTDSQINFNWFSSSPDPATIAPDTFSVRWTGRIDAPSSETVTFIARVDDGVRLWINDTLIIDKWVTTAPIDRIGSYAMTAGTSYSIKLEYMENNGGAQIQLYWQTPTIAKQLIPSTHLHPESTTAPEPPPVDEDTTANSSSSLLRLETGSSTNFTDSSGNVWLSDRYFSGGGVVSTSVAVADTVNDRIYNTFRYGNFSYNIPISNGSYTLKLFFNDPTYTTPGNRVFDVFAENALVLDNFDIVAAGGAKTAISRSFPVTVSDGTLNVRVANVSGNNALLAGIQVFSSTTTTPTTPTTITWTTKKAAPVKRAEALRAVIDGKIYMFGGFVDPDGPVTRSDVYDPATDTWAPIAPLPDRLTHAGVTWVGRNVYFVGGYVGKGTIGWDQTFGTKKAFRYNVDENKYYDIPYLPVERAGGGLVALGNELHYFSGDNLSRNNVGDHYVLNLAGGTTWTTAAPLPSARSHMGYEAVGGKIYAIGGQKGNDAGLTTQSTVSVYNPATNTWTNVASLPRGISHISSATLVTSTGKIMVFGGETGHNAAVSSVYIYDPSLNQWSTTTSLPGTRFSGVAGFINGKIYFTTGSSQTTTWEGVLS